MAYSDGLLQLAAELANLDVAEPRQASLRRSISTAYYALFHKLIEESTANWAHTGLRTELGRVFEHGKMKSACAERSRQLNVLARNGIATEGGQKLLLVVDAFLVLQEARHLADYDNGKEWTRTDALEHIALAAEAFTSWSAIRDDDDAQAVLVALLGKRRRSE